MLDRATVLGTQWQEVEIYHDGWQSRRRVLWGGAAVAASFAAFIAGIGLWSKPVEQIETAVGEIRRVPLKDGSMAAVNTSTKLAIDMRPEIRQIALDRGEAWFQVAHDRARPFVVEVGNVRVRAVGTAFSVRRTDAGADVQVTEGVVEVWSVADQVNKRRVSAGARTFVSGMAGPQPAVEASTDIDRNLAWRSGQLIFDGDTLGAAAAEFNRYNAVQVRIADPSLADERFVGRFRTNEPDAFARAAAAILGARAHVGDDEIVLSRK
jgi:transmembrane sensor